MKIRNSQHRQRRAAFTLMEMMVVVAIIVALAGTGIYYMAGQIDEGNKAKAQANIKSLTDATINYKANHAGSWPPDIDTLLLKDEQGYGPYVRTQEDLLDPWGVKYSYDVNGPRNSNNQPDIWTQHPSFGTFGNWAKKWQRQ